MKKRNLKVFIFMFICFVAADLIFYVVYGLFTGADMKGSYTTMSLSLGLVSSLVMAYIVYDMCKYVECSTNEFKVRRLFEKNKRLVISEDGTTITGTFKGLYRLLYSDMVYNKATGRFIAPKSMIDWRIPKQ